MEVKVRPITLKREMLSACNVTVWKPNAEKEPTERFCERLYKAEHSPIRDRWFVIEIKDIPYWVSTHLVRHHIGYTPYVSTQREDRIEYTGSRADRKQGELVNMRITLNAQAFISVSRKRLCGLAHKKTRKLWYDVVAELAKVDKELANNCVPECIYRGFCPEMKICHYAESTGAKIQREEYIKGYTVI